jgi:hypothetical protein
MIKEYIVEALKWALSKFEPKPTFKEKLTAWPFPTGHEPQLVIKKKPVVKKATTRTVAKKATTVAKKTTKKAK